MRSAIPLRTEPIPLAANGLSAGLWLLPAIVVALVIGRLRDQQARAVPRANREIQVGVVKPTRRPLDPSEVH